MKVRIARGLVQDTDSTLSASKATNPAVLIMSSNHRIYLLPALLLSVASLQATAIEAQTFDLKVEAAIVLYHRAATKKPKPSFMGNEKILVAKVSKVLQGNESSEYILILTGRQFSKADFDVRKLLQFNLTRVKGLDDTVRNRLYFPGSARNETAFARLLFSKGVRREEVPLDKTLPCYLFRGNDYPNEWWKRLSKPK